MSAEQDTSRRQQLRDEVIQGTDGFLFQRFEMAFEQLCSNDVPTDRQLARWVHLFETRFAWCAAKKIPYTTLVVPARHVIYADKLPSSMRPSDDRPVGRLRHALDPAMQFALVYPDDMMLTARAESEVFLRTDQHLNASGSYVCYLALLEHIRPALPLAPISRETLVVERRQWTGDLGMRLDEEPFEDLETWRLAGNSRALRVFRGGRAQRRVEVYHHENPGLPTALVFGDSNVDSILPFLVPHFSRLVVLFGCERLFHDLVLSERPDIVINLMAEVRLGNLAPGAAVRLPIDNDAQDFGSYCEELLPRKDAKTVFDFDFTIGGNSSEICGDGWSYVEATHTWAVGPRSILTIPGFSPSAPGIEGSGQRILELELSPHVALPDHPTQRLVVSVGRGDRWVELGAFTVDRRMTLRMPVPDDAMGLGEAVVLMLDHPDGFSPLSIGAQDARLLSLAVYQLLLIEN